MTKSALSAAAFALLSVVLMNSAAAQNAVLAELYGRGVHAYYAGDNHAAEQFLSMAINNGSKDPRAFYFRGLVACASGNTYAAEADWQRGAELEASGQANAAIGRALARFQGNDRIKLERIRQQARIQALANAMMKSKIRYGENNEAENRALRRPAQPGSSVAPPPTPPAAGSSPFDNDTASGEPEVESDNSLDGALENPFKDDPAAADAPAAGNNPFEPAGGDEPSPFGDPGAGGDSSPFGDDAGAMDDNPFGDAGGADDNPFGN